MVEKDIKKLIEQYPGHKGFSFFYQKCPCEIGECNYVNQITSASTLQRNI